MASNFYARYIPPSRKDEKLGSRDHGDETPAPPRKRRKNVSGSEEIQGGPQKYLTPAAGEKKKKRKEKRREEQSHDEGRSVVHEPPLLEDTKHKKLLDRFEKFSKSTLDPKGETGAEGHTEDSDTEMATTEDMSAIELHGLEPIPQPAMQTETLPFTVQHLPQWLSNPILARSDKATPFKDLPLSTSTIQALEKRGYSIATPIQSAILPLLLPGPNTHRGDLCIASGTGTGKTIAFMAPMIESLSKRPTTVLRGLVIVPTREAVSQTFAIAEMCAAKSGLQIRTAKGGKTLKQERKLIIRRYPRWDPEAFAEKQNALRSNSPHDFDSSESDCSDQQAEFIRNARDYVADYEFKADILICTPGRVVEHMKRGRGFNLDHIEWLVIDEMDRLMSEHYQDWADIVITAVEADPALAKHKQRLEDGQWTMYQKRVVRKIIASATMTTDLAKLEALKLHRPKVVIVDGVGSKLESPKAPGQSELPIRNAFYQIPTTLTEITVPVLDVAYKPLQLLQLLQPIFDDQNDSGKPRSLQDNHRTTVASQSLSNGHASEDTSSDGSDTDASTSQVSTPTSSSPSSGSRSESGSDDSDSPKPSRDAIGSSKGPASGALVFTSTNESSLRLARLLSLLRPDWAPFIGSFTGTSTSATRRKMLAAFRKRQLLVLIASNLASRSLNLSDVKYVVNYDIPASVEMYVHRVGRTARAGKEGTAITLLAHHEARWFWQEIGKGADVRREGKVARGQAEKIGRAEKREYEDALAALGSEARGAAGRT